MASFASHDVEIGDAILITVGLSNESGVTWEVAVIVRVSVTVSYSKVVEVVVFVEVVDVSLNVITTDTELGVIPEFGIVEMEGVVYTGMLVPPGHKISDDVQNTRI